MPKVTYFEVRDAIKGYKRKFGTPSEIVHLYFYWEDEKGFGCATPERASWGSSGDAAWSKTCRGCWSMKESKWIPATRWLKGTAS